MWFFVASVVVVSVAVVVVAALASVVPPAVVSVAFLAVASSVVAEVASRVVVLFDFLFLCALVHIVSLDSIGDRLGSSGHSGAVFVAHIVPVVSSLPWCEMSHALLLVAHLSV